MAAWGDGTKVDDLAELRLDVAAAEQHLADAILGDSPEMQALRHRFFRELFEQDWQPAQHVAALRGWLMRAHVDQAHPGQAEQVAQLHLPHFPEDQHEAWLFGYRWREKQGAPCEST